MKVTIGRMLRKKDASDGAMTPFQAVCTALAATVGTGNIVGVAGAIAIGGPGAVGSFFISMKKVCPEEFSLMRQVLVPDRLHMHVQIQKNR